MSYLPVPDHAAEDFDFPPLQKRLKPAGEEITSPDGAWVLDVTRAVHRSRPGLRGRSAGNGS